MIQTWAILTDAYRELNARKMFWISLGISLMVVCVFGILGIDEKGVNVLSYPLEFIPINTSIISRGLFYKSLFSNVGLTIWLGWASTILALVSTASIIPDFVSSGAIEGMLARPISRTRLFLTKYFASLMFVVLQALVFTGISVVVIGLRGGVWLWSLLLAVPLVTLFFSYIYCVSALVGVWTRSTLAALLAALALWGVIIVVGWTERGVLIWKVGTDAPIALMERDVEARVQQIASAKAKSTDPADFAALERKLAEKQNALVEQRAKAGRVGSWYNFIYTAKLILPKNGETKGLLDRAVVSDREMEKMLAASEERDRRDAADSPFSPADLKAVRQADQIRQSHSLWWVIGTSLLFEGVVVGWACRIFAKRDF